MPSDKINVLECLVKVQHLQRIANECDVYIEFYPKMCFLYVTLESANNEYEIFCFSIKNSFQENSDELQSLEEKFNLFNKKQDD